MARYKETGTNNLFGEDFRFEKISKHGDPLEKLNAVINWNIFTPVLQELENKKQDSNIGAKPYSPLVIIKTLILQRYYNLNDSQIEYKMLDHLSFCRFLGLTLSDKVPDENTIWDFRERITNQDLDINFFSVFHDKLEENELIVHDVKIIDVCFVEMSRQHNNREENKHIKKTGTAPETWEDTPNKKRQKDVDACWTNKNN